MFKRKKRPASFQRQIRIFQAAHSYLLVTQRKWADWLHFKTKHWKPRQQKLFLFALCIAMGGCSTYNILQSLKAKSVIKQTYNVPKPQPLPPLIHSPLQRPVPAVPDSTIFRRFHRHVDSLLQSPEGKRQYEQFLKERPGFLDSMALAEKLLLQSFPNQIK